MFKRSGKKSGISTKQHSAARIRQRRMIAIALATLVSAVTLLWLVLRKNDPVVPYTWRDFEQAFERGDDDRMIVMYDELRLFRADLISTDRSSVQSVITETDQLIKRVEEKYVLFYADNGPGYHETYTTKGIKNKLGISLINNMVRQLQAEHSHYNDNGAVFKMIFQEKTVSKI